MPLQGVLLIAIIPRAMPWAKSFCPFRACRGVQGVWGRAVAYMGVQGVWGAFRACRTFWWYKVT